MSHWSAQSLFLSFRSILAAVIALALVGCSDPAPISVSFRPSKANSATLVMQVRNSGGGHLSCKMNVRNETQGQSRTYPFGLGPGESTEIGFIEADWMFQTGEKYEIEVEGFSSYEGHVP